MTRQIKLQAEKRKEKGGKKVLSQNFIPAVIYGPGVKPENVKVGRLDFERVFAIAGESNLISLSVGGKEAVKVVVKDIQKDILKDKVKHIDFYQVDMKKKINAGIPLHFIGEAKAVKELGGILVKGADTAEVNCLPGNLIDHIDVDISFLNTLHDFIRIKDLKLPAGVEFTSEGEEVIAHVVMPKAEEEAKLAEAAAEIPAAETAAEEGKKAGEGEEKKP